MRLIGVLTVALLSITLAASAGVPRPGTCPKIAYGEPTTEYGHGVLGDGGEYKTIEIRRDRVSLSGEKHDQWTFTYRLPAGRVFEDTALHCTDLDGEGLNEIIVVESDIEMGAQLTVYQAERDLNRRIVRMAMLAATPPIGRAFRWLAISGIADFDGDNGLDIAYVVTPHIGGTLRIWSLRDGGLVEIAADPGYSNHRIGQDFIAGGVRDCGNGPELVLPNTDWSRSMLVWFGSGGLETAEFAKNAAPDTIARALECS